MKRAIWIAALSLLLGGVGQARANLITNGGFETGDFTGWTHTGNLGATGVSPFYAHSGNFGAQLGPVGSDGYLYQNLATNAGDTYQLDYWLEMFSGPPDNFAAQLNLAGTGLNPGGTDIPGSVINNGGSFPYTEYTFNFVATGPTTTVGFRFQQNPSYFGLDDVSVNDIGPAVPEPASLTLLGLGIAGMAGYGWRRRKLATVAS